MRGLLRVCWITSLVALLVLLADAVLPELKIVHILIYVISFGMSLDFITLNH